MNVQPSSTTVSSCVLTPLVASHANALLGLPSTTLPASVSRDPSFPLRGSFLPLLWGCIRWTARSRCGYLTPFLTSLGRPPPFLPNNTKQLREVSLSSPMLPPDNNECTSDINLCGSKGVCQNTPGSFTCECKRGFSLDQSGASCEGRCRPQLGLARSALQGWPVWVSASVSCKNYSLFWVWWCCNPSTWGAESGGLPQVGGQPKIKK